MCMLGRFSCVLSSSDFSSSKSSKNSFMSTIRVSNSLDPVQVRHFVGSNLDLKLLANVIVNKE